ncbi:MAG TPA: TetR/AcrR family transcriptional regulator [Patescibacteria group bacterium]|nr:TetR/AcrR family transcriptional regulator [Patescibacteria group bacterium]
MDDGAAQPHKAKIRRENRTRILVAAEQAFAEHGFAGATMTNIAKRASLPKANLHYYFGTKDELYRAVLDSILEEWISKLNLWRIDADPGTVIKNYIRDKLEFSRRRPQASKVFASEIIHGAPILASFISADLRHLVEQKAAVVHEWVRLGLIKPVDGPHFIFTLWALTQHYADFEVQIRLILGRDALTDDDWESIAGYVEVFVLRAVGLAS